MFIVRLPHTDISRVLLSIEHRHNSATDFYERLYESTKDEKESVRLEPIFYMLLVVGKFHLSCETNGHVG